jgi:hydroxyethylthiazole kinase
MRVPKPLAAKRTPVRGRAAQQTTIRGASSSQAISNAEAAGELKASAAEVLERVRSRSPRVHCITNMVAQNFTANMLLALGAVPSMTIAPDEVGEFAAKADALIVNLGTFDAERRSAAEIAIRSITGAGRPWVLDPVFAERSKTRAAFAKALIDQGPRALRLNRAEFTALAGAPSSEVGLRAYALETDVALGVTGETDLVTDGGRLARIANGHSLMGKVTAMGCAASAVVAACLAVEPDAWRAVAAGLMLFGVAGELAGARATGPGSFAAAMLDAVYALNGDVLMEEARVAC